jgi:radical SAM protein with 4Fe4S-binding SPASM domain
LALVEATRGATVEVVPAPLACPPVPCNVRAVDQAAEAERFQRLRSLQPPGLEDCVEALLRIYRDPRIPLRLVSPLSWVAARVNSEAPMVSSLAAAGAEVAVLPDGSLYAGEEAAGREDWRLGNVLDDAQEIRWERLDAMPETFASSVKPERCVSCDWRWRCGGVDAAVVLLEEKQKAESGKQKAGGGVDASSSLLEAAAGQGPAGNGTGGAPAAVLEDAGRMPAPLFDLYCAPRKRLFEEMLWGSAEAAARQQPRPGRERIELREDGIDFAPVNNTQKHRI